MNLKTYIGTLQEDERPRFAEACGTSWGHLKNVMYGHKSCATDLAVRIWEESGGAVTRQELRDDWADHWPELRESAGQGA